MANPSAILVGPKCKRNFSGSEVGSFIKVFATVRDVREGIGPAKGVNDEVGFVHNEEENVFLPEAARRAREGRVSFKRWLAVFSWLSEVSPSPLNKLGAAARLSSHKDQQNSTQSAWRTAASGLTFINEMKSAMDLP